MSMLPLQKVPDDPVVHRYRLRFFMRFVYVDEIHPVFPRWAAGTPIEVVTSTAAKAIVKARSILDDPPEGQCLKLRIDKISEE